MKVRRRTESPRPAEQEDAAGAPEPRRRATGSRLGWFASRLFILFLLLAVLVFFAPTIISKTSAWSWILAKAKGDKPYLISTGAPTLSWLSPVVIPALEVKDANGELLVVAEKIATEKALLSLALNPSQPGLIELTRPRVQVKLTGAATTTPQPAPAPAPQSTASSIPLGLSVRVVDGTVEIIDVPSNRTWNFAGVNVAVDTPKSALEPLAFDASLQMSSAGSQVGSLSAKGNLVLPPGAKPIGDVNLTATGIDLALIGPLASKTAGDLVTQGILSTKIVAQFAEGGAVRVQLQELSVPELAVAAPKQLGNDVVVIRQLGGQGEIAVNGANITAKQFTLASDVLRLDADGILHLGEMTPAGFFKAFASGNAGEPLQIAAQANLARIAQCLPNTIKLREGTQIQSGLIALQVQRDPQSAVPRVQGTLRSSELVALNNGQKIKWDQPITATFAVSQSEQGPKLEQLQCIADFLRIDAKGTLTEGEASLQGDLDRLMVELDKIIDVPELKLAGGLQGKVEWKHGAADAWAAEAQVRLQDFKVQAPAMQPWQEKDLQLTAQFSGVVHEGALQRIDRGTAGIVSGNDRLTAQLTQPVEAPSANSVWPVSWKVTGDLATWLPRLQPVAPVRKIRAEGELLLEGSAAVSTTSVTVNQCLINGKQVRAQAPGLFIDEDELKFETTAAWDGKAGKISIPVTTFASSTLAFRADKLEINYGAQGFSAAGQLDYLGNVERLAQLIEDPRTAPKTKFGGDLKGRIQLVFQQGVTEARLTGNVTDLVYATPDQPAPGTALVSSESPWKVRWADKALAVQGQLSYDAAKDTLKITTADIQASQIRAGAAGQIAALTTQPFVDISGKLVYDLAEVMNRVREIDVVKAAIFEAQKNGKKSFWQELQLEGREERPFSLRGPLNAISATTDTTSVAPNVPRPTGLVSDALEGNVGFGWKSVQYAGLQAGAADIQARLQKGNVDFAPIDIPISEGRLKATPHILLNNNPALAVVDRGPLLEHVQISQELCRGWLKFVAPLVADATAAQGKFSIDLEGVNVPLFEPEKCDVAGALKIHDAAIGPGPLAMQLIGFLQQAKSVVGNPDGGTTDPATWMMVKDQQIDFRVVQGRVHHRNMKIMIKDVELTTDGSVGFDQTLELVATVPLKDSWLKGELAAALKGQSIQVPIRGTIQKPQLDRRGLEELTKKFVRGAAKNLLEDQLNKGLKGLFGPKE